MVTSTPANRHHRKALGAFYSADALVGPLVDWAVTQPDQSVLDPSCGDGVFLQAAARRLVGLGTSRRRVASLLRGIDLNPAASQVTRMRLASELGFPFSNVTVGSFFALHPPGSLFAPEKGVDVVLGNPPYIRYQDFGGTARREARDRAASSGVRLNQLASSWAHFVAHAMSFLRPEGRLALILPAELIHTSYSAPLRDELRRSFAEIHIVSFRQAVFPEVQEEVVLLLAQGRGRGPGSLRLMEIEAGGDLANLSHQLRPGIADLDKRVKEVCLKTIDLKAEWARTAGRGGGPTSDLLSWLKQSRSSAYLLLAIRVVDEKDLERTIGFANAANPMMDGVGLFAYQLGPSGQGYLACKVPRHLDLELVMSSRICTALRALP